MSAILAFLGSCSSDSPARSSGPKASPVTNNSTQETLAPISALPPDSAERPLLPGQEGTIYSPDGLPALLPSKGISADQLFAEKISDDDKRMDRIENAIIEMRREFDAIKPAIIRLSAVESDMQDLITQLQTVTGSAPPQPMPEESVNAESVQASAPAAPIESAGASNGEGVTNIRSGMQGPVARLVLDINSKPTYTRDLDNAEHVLIIELSDTAWSAPEVGTFKKSSLLKSWSVKKDGGNSVAIIQLSGPAQVSYEAVLPGKDGAGSRLVLDLAPQ